MIANSAWLSWCEDCWRWRGEILTGALAHWCDEWDGLPVDETSDEMEVCTCIKEEAKFMIKHYARLCFPGIFFPETEQVDVNEESRDMAKRLFRKHKNCYRIEFWHRTVRKVDGEVLMGEGIEGQDFLCGKPYTLAEMKKTLDPKKDEILISNVECNRWKGAVKCRAGNWQPWENVAIIDPGDL